MEIMGCRYQTLRATVEGYARTGVPLVSGEYGQIGCSEDIGPYYFIPKLMHLGGLQLDVAIDVFYIGIVALSFLAGAPAIWLYCKTYLGRVVSLLGFIFLSFFIHHRKRRCLCYPRSNSYSVGHLVAFFGRTRYRCTLFFILYACGIYGRYCAFYSRAFRNWSVIVPCDIIPYYNPFFLES